MPSQRIGLGAGIGAWLVIGIAVAGAQGIDEPAPTDSTYAEAYVLAEPPLDAVELAQGPVKIPFYTARLPQREAPRDAAGSANEPTLAPATDAVPGSLPRRPLPPAPGSDTDRVSRQPPLAPVQQPDLSVPPPGARAGIPVDDAGSLALPAFPEAAIADRPWCTGQPLVDPCDRCAGGFIDNAVVSSRFRLRVDDLYDDRRPDRAEYMYGHALGGGVRSGEMRIDAQEFDVYFELAQSERFSVFVEIPARGLEVTGGHAADSLQQAGGLGDVVAGFKYALVACPDRYLTFQLKVDTATGDAQAGLGTGHSAIEPGLLAWRRVGEHATLLAEVRDWQALGSSDPALYSGNVLRYSGGLGYDLYSGRCAACCERLTAVVEVVGWTVLAGKQTDPTAGTISAIGDTIVDLGLGPRYTFGPNSFYAGWAHALTEQAWYRDVARVEFCRVF